MKTAKLGAMFLISVLALAGIGVGYATWTDTVDINGQINTGIVKIGIRDTGTSDPGDTLDPRREVVFGGAPVVTPDKHVATTTSTNGDHKCEHSGNSFYDSITYLYDNVYPGYAPTVYHEICNCGTIPVHLTFSGSYTGNIAILNYIDLVHWKVTDNTILQGEGTDYATLNALLDGYQLHPCHRLEITEEIHFYTNDLPQDDWVAWTITVTGTQWNE